MSYRLGIDVGGTFTDFLVLGEGRRIVHKTSSTPDDPSRGVVAGLAEIAELVGKPADAFLAEVDLVVHGTTVTTNAVLTHNGARTALVTTKGFRDVLALRDGTREDPYDNRLSPPRPLVPRRLRLPVTERVDRTGREVEALDEEELRAVAATLAREKVEAVAVSFMHSPTNPAHEQRALELLRELLPDAYLTASAELLPQIRFYPRTSTAVLNAYVGPIISRYLEALTRRLEDGGFGGVLLIMQSNGGVATPAELSERAALSLLSGPASGPTAGLWHVAPHDLRDCITIDMGGTSFDAALVKDGAPLVMTDGVVDRWRLALPMIDIHTIGAGGGSIAGVDAGGLLHVGPQSAGAVPGPACYGRGGTEPTVTDADLVLGYLSETSFTGMPLDEPAARSVLERGVGEPLGLDTVHAAAGVYDLVNVTMAAGVRDISVRRGLDPRDFPLVVAGGAGPLHAAAIARELEIPLLVVPRESAIFCAAGMLMCDFKHDRVRTYKAKLADVDGSRLAALFDEMRADVRERLSREGVSEEDTTAHAALDLRYVGQWHEMTMAVDLPLDLAAVEEAFHSAHDRLFGFSSDYMPVELLAARLTAVGRTEPVPLPELSGQDADLEAARVGERLAWSASARELVPAAVYDGHALGPGASLAGPALVELPTTTIVVPDDFELTVDRFGSYVLYAGERGRALAARLQPERAAAGLEPTLAREGD
jgi:N-methylhydantoinase A